MRQTTLLLVLVLGIGCEEPQSKLPDVPMPPNTILLSQMMRELSSHPGFTDKFLDEIDKGNKKGAAILTPALVDDLRRRILGGNWQGLDTFPGWTMAEINPAVRVVGHVAGKNDTLEDLSAVHPGASLPSAGARQFLDIGPYSLDHAETVALDTPSKLPGFTTDGIITNLGEDVLRGDGPGPLAPEHAESQRLADVLNRLSANSLEGAQHFQVTLPSATPGNGKQPSAPLTAGSPQELIQLLQTTGHDVSVTDTRAFANFGHLHYAGKDVMAPFWVNAQIIIPRSSGRPLLIPVAHAEYEWHIRGPLLNADVSYYFGVDGKSQWRTMDTLDQPWVLKRDAHTYRDANAVEVTRLTHLLTVAYMHLHTVHPSLPFGGYYAFGVCQDGVSAIEKKMTGKVTLFPNTADESFFKDPRDAEVNSLIIAIPKDRNGIDPEPERIFGSIPTDNFTTITIPGLANDLKTVHDAWTDGTLGRASRTQYLRFRYFLLVIAIGIGAAYFIVSRRKQPPGDYFARPE